MKQRLLEALKGCKADYAEIRYETDEFSNLALRKDKVESTEVASFAGGVVRACKNGGWAQVVVDDLDKIKQAVEEACQCAALIGREKTQLAEVDIVDNEIRKTLARDFRGVDIRTKFEMLHHYNDIILGAGDSIESSRVSYADRFRTVFFANSFGSYYMEERPEIKLAYSATAAKGDLVQRAHDHISSTHSYDDLLGADKGVATVAGRAVELLSAPKCEGGPQTIIVDPSLGGVFVHEAFGHLSEADFLYENPKMRDMMKLGRKVGVDFLNVVDDGTLEHGWGSYAYDDEGTPAQKKYLIRNGELASHLHSRETAAKMGELPTGNARAQSRSHVPVVRMTNTFIEPGSTPKEELFKGVDKGIYACDCFGGQTMMEMFTFSAAYGYIIENGKIGELVRDVVLTGNVFETLMNIESIADDFDIWSGTCGKAGQSVPAGTGSPHVRIKDVVIGGC